MLWLGLQVVGTSAMRLSWGRSSATSRPAIPSSASSYAYSGSYATPLSTYPPAYAAPGYGSLQQSLNPVADPYAAYAYAYSQQAAAADPSIYQVWPRSLSTSLQLERSFL